jgi:hypothetical protein
MTTARYIEIDSTYRDRNQWPLASEFQIPISQTGRKGQEDAVDPVSTSSTTLIWQASHFIASSAVPPVLPSVILVTLEAFTIPATGSIGASSGRLVLTVNSSPGDLQPIDDYYNGAVMIITGTPTDRSRILDYKYLGDDRAQFTIENAFTGATTPGVTTFDITDPTDLTQGVPAPPSGWNSFIFIPTARLGDNALNNTIVYNMTRNEYRPLEIYDKVTHLVKIDTSGSNVSAVNQGPVTNWLNTDLLSLREDPPLSCLTLDGDPINNIVTYNSFNFNITDAPPNINLRNGYLELQPQYRTRAIVVAGTTNTITLAAADLVAGNGNTDFYKGGTVRMTTGAAGAWPLSAQGQVREIVAYNPVTNVITVQPGFVGVPPAPGDEYVITYPSVTRRITKYIDYRDTLDGGSATTLLFPNTASDINGFYNNVYINLNNGAVAPNTGTRLITDYTVNRDATGAIISRVATINSAFPFAPVAAAGMTFTITSGTVSPSFDSSVSQQLACILPFSYDNLNPFVYTGSQVSQQDQVCYDIELLNLVLPNQTLNTSYGSLVSFYQYVYVEFQNVSASGAGLNNVIYSNNPNSTKMTFRAAIDDVPNPVNSTFIKIDSDGMVQNIKFKPNDTLKFSVRFKSGELFETILPERYGPHTPNPLVQISACFAIKRL